MRQSFLYRGRPTPPGIGREAERPRVRRLPAPHAVLKEDASVAAGCAEADVSANTAPNMMITGPASPNSAMHGNSARVRDTRVAEGSVAFSVTRTGSLGETPAARRAAVIAAA